MLSKKLFSLYSSSYVENIMVCVFWGWFTMIFPSFFHECCLIKERSYKDPNGTHHNDKINEKKTYICFCYSWFVRFGYTFSLYQLHQNGDLETCMNIIFYGWSMALDKAIYKDQD
jgi:hypothetical protein